MKSLLEVGYQKILSVAEFHGGRYGWCATTKSRWKRFCDFCDNLEIYSISQISQQTLKNYADFRCANLADSTAQNYISSVNAVLKLIDPMWVTCSPKNLTGCSRKSVRTVPLSFNLTEINSAVCELECEGFIDLALLVRLAAEFGLRRREVALLDISNALKEASKFGSIDIQRGTKGGRGRGVPRWIPCGNDGISLLEISKKYLSGNRCLVPPNGSLKTFYDRISNSCLPVLKKSGIEKFHYLRVFYACRRYKEITGCVAPCNRIDGDAIPCCNLDESARKLISAELGHSRLQIVSCYIGRKIRRGKDVE